MFKNPLSQGLTSLGFVLLFHFYNPSPLVAGDCLVDSWPVVFDTSTPVPSLFLWSGNFEGECEYGVEFKDQSSAFLQMNYSDLTLPAPTAPHVFELRLKTSHLLGHDAGYLRVFELLRATPYAMGGQQQADRATIALELAWDLPTRGGQTVFHLRGSYGTQHPIFTHEVERYFLDPSAVAVAQGNTSIHVKIVWLPSTAEDQADGSIELWANDQLIASKSGIRLPATGFHAPNAVRFGAIPTADKLGRGTLRFVPIQPTPNYPWLD